MIEVKEVEECFFCKESGAPSQAAIAFVFLDGVEQSKEIRLQGREGKVVYLCDPHMQHIFVRAGRVMKDPGPIIKS